MATESWPFQARRRSPGIFAQGARSDGRTELAMGVSRDLYLGGPSMTFAVGSNPIAIVIWLGGRVEIHCGISLFVQSFNNQVYNVREEDNSPELFVFTITSIQPLCSNVHRSKMCLTSGSVFSLSVSPVLPSHK